MIGIRVDANEKIAMGHLMRCLSIAKQLKALNQEVLFIVSEEHSIQQIEEEGFRSICLYNSYRDKGGELPRLLELIQRYSIKKILIDSYEVTQQYMSAIQLHCKVVYIDDMNLFRYPADMIINYTFKTEMQEYAGKGYDKELFLLGSQYVPLRPAFAQGCIDIKESVDDIFLSTGGTDEYDMLVGILELMQRSSLLRDKRKHVVVGKFYRNLPKLKELAENSDRIRIYHNIPDIWNVMIKCDLAISAGGTTLAELSALGVPTICFAIADNQLKGIRAYAEEHMMLFAGNVMEKRDEVIKKVISESERLVYNYQARESLAKRANCIIDGNGAMRIAENIVNM